MAIKYLDSKRIRGSSTAAATPTYTPSMASTSGWSIQDSSKVNITGGKIAGTSGTGSAFADFTRDNSNDAISFDLGSAVSDSQWTMRFKFTIDTVSFNHGSGCSITIGLWDHPSSDGFDTAGDNISLSTLFSNQSSERDLEGNYTSDASGRENTTEIGSNILVASKTFYCTINRKTVTTCSVSVTENSDYTTSATTVNITPTSSVTGLRYFGAYNHVGYSVDNHVYGSIEDVKIWNERDADGLTTDEKATLINSFADSLGTAGNATSNNGTLDTTNMKVGSGCLNFDGDSTAGGSPANQNIDCFAALNSMGGEGTVAMWVNSTTSQERIIWSVQDASASVGLEVKTRSNNPPFFAINASGGGMSPIIELVGTETYTVGSWVHLTITQDGTNCKIYTNGVVGQSGTDSGDWIEDMSGIDGGRIGCKAPRNSGSINEGFDGKLDEIGIWDRALTQGEVTLLQTNSPSTIPSGLKVYYDCESATVINNAVDYSDLPENTLFEQTDNRELYWLQSNAWVYGGAFSAITAGGGNRASDTFYNQTYISSGGAGGAWTASTTFTGSSANNGSMASMGGGGKSNFIMAGGYTTWESSEEGELDTSYKFTDGTWVTLSGAYRGQWSTGGGNQTDAIRMGGRNSGYTNNAATWGGSSWTNITGMNFHQGASAGDGTSTNGVCFGGFGSSSGSNPQQATDRSDYWNGSSWTSATGKLTARRANATYGGNNTSGIHCGGATYDGSSYTYNRPDCETWNGSSMTEVQDLPAGTDGAISGGNDTKAMVWCGSLGSGGTTQTDATYTWNGSAWTTKTVHPVARYRPHGGAEGL